MWLCLFVFVETDFVFLFGSMFVDGIMNCLRRHFTNANELKYLRQPRANVAVEDLL